MNWANGISGEMGLEGLHTLDVTVTTGTKGDDTLDGGAGKDLIRGLAGDDLIHGGTGADHLLGGKGADTIDGGAGQDTIDGGAGDDLIIASGGGRQQNQGDHVEGGDGFDFLSFAAITGPVVVNLATDLAFSDQTHEMLLSGVEGVIGTGGDDRMVGDISSDTWFIGGEGADTLDGGGNSTLDGGAGDDILVGHGGADLLIGGAGADRIGTGFHDRSGNTILYQDLGDSTNAAPDGIGGLRGTDVIDLHLIDADATQAGDQAFHLVEGGFTGHAGELLLTYDQASDLTALTVDVDGDAEADMTIQISGDASGFHHFVL